MKRSRYSHRYAASGYGAYMSPGLACLCYDNIKQASFVLFAA